MNATTQIPKVFISYSWTDSNHEKFVLDLATALRSHGVDAILDKWDLRPGQDKFVFMESMVTDPSVSRVLVICDKKYQEKADARAGGVGTESQIISQELYGRVNQTKFIPVICEYDEESNPCLPVFMKHLIYVDISSEERYGAGLDELLRLIYEQPLYQKPSLGAAPTFASAAGIPYAKELGALTRSIQENKPNRQGLEIIFLKSILGEVEKLYAEPTGSDFHLAVYDEISATKTLRDQMSDYCDTVATFSNDDPSTVHPIVQILENLGSHFGPPVTNGSFYPGWADIYRYFGLEVLLIQVAALVRHRRWQTLHRLLESVFLVQDRHGNLVAEGFDIFNAPIVSMDTHRNQSLNLQRMSVSADILKERCSPAKTSFIQMQEADVFLALAAAIKYGAEIRNGHRCCWVPRTGVYFSYGTRLPLFLRAADASTRAGILLSIGIKDGIALQARLSAVSTDFGGFGHLAKGQFSDFDFLEAINVKELTK